MTDQKIMMLSCGTPMIVYFELGDWRANIGTFGNIPVAALKGEAFKRAQNYINAMRK